MLPTPKKSHIVKCKHFCCFVVLHLCKTTRDTLTPHYVAQDTKSAGKTMLDTGKTKTLGQNLGSRIHLVSQTTVQGSDPWLIPTLSAYWLEPEGMFTSTAFMYADLLFLWTWYRWDFRELRFWFRTKYLTHVDMEEDAYHSYQAHLQVPEKNLLLFFCVSFSYYL